MFLGTCAAFVALCCFGTALRALLAILRACAPCVAHCCFGTALRAGGLRPLPRSLVKIQRIELRVAGHAVPFFWRFAHGQRDAVLEATHLIGLRSESPAR
jgi:hypothetical protein